MCVCECVCVCVCQLPIAPLRGGLSLFWPVALCLCTTKAADVSSSDGIPERGQGCMHGT